MSTVAPAASTASDSAPSVGLASSSVLPCSRAVAMASTDSWAMSVFRVSCSVSASVCSEAPGK